jgi:hypothetical protein
MRAVLAEVAKLCFASDVLIAVLASLSVLVLAIASLVAFGRLYRLRFLTLVRRAAQIEGSALPRKMLEKAIRRGHPDASLIAACESGVTAIIDSIYCFSGPALPQDLRHRRDQAILRLAAARFPEIILSKGERAIFYRRRDGDAHNGELIFNLILSRELYRIYGVELALRALRAAEGSADSESKRSIDICRLRVGSGRNLSRPVLRYILKMSDQRMKPLVRSELMAA